MCKKESYDIDMAERELISFDWALKYILRDKANFDVLEGFLRELTGENLTILELLESESNADAKNQKCNRVDLLAKDSEDSRILVEVQYVREIDYFQRMLFGTSKLITEHISRGEAYGKIKKIISVHIVYFDLGFGSDYLYKGSTSFTGVHDGSVLNLNTYQKEMFNVKDVSQIFPQYYIIRIGSYDDTLKTSLDEWIYFLKHSSIQDTFKAESIVTANQKLDVLKLNSAERRRYNDYMEDISYQKSIFMTAQFEGLKEGKIEGKIEGAHEKAVETALKLRTKGMCLQDICECTGLTEQEIEAL